MANKHSVSDLGPQQLVERLAEEKDRLFKLRFQLATGQLDNTARIKQTKKDIARLLGALRAAEIATAEAMSGDEA
jgi:large subunit ribosomal protein L29